MDHPVIYGVTRAGIVRHIVNGDGEVLKAKCGIPLAFPASDYDSGHGVCRTCMVQVEPRAKGLPFMQSKNPRLFNQDCPQCRRAAQAHLVGGMDASVREMKGHPRCDRCSVLLGDGHLDQGRNGRCGTHSR